MMLFLLLFLLLLLLLLLLLFVCSEILCFNVVYANN